MVKNISLMYDSQPEINRCPICNSPDISVYEHGSSGQPYKIVCGNCGAVMRWNGGNNE